MGWSVEDVSEEAVNFVWEKYKKNVLAHYKQNGFCFLKRNREWDEEFMRDVEWQIGLFNDYKLIHFRNLLGPQVMANPNLPITEDLYRAIRHKLLEDSKEHHYLYHAVEEVKVGLVGLQEV